MHSTLEFVLRHGYTLVFLVVLMEQAGLPIPSLPVLLAVGALAGAGKLSLPLALGLAVVASLIADSIWYELGRLRGHSILSLLLLSAEHAPCWSPSLSPALARQRRPWQGCCVCASRGSSRGMRPEPCS